MRQHDETADSIDELVRDLEKADDRVFIAGGPAGKLPWIGDGHLVFDPVLMLIPAYCAVEAAARRRGLNPDSSPYLSKVTGTL